MEYIVTCKVCKNFRTQELTKGKFPKKLHCSKCGKNQPYDVSITHTQFMLMERQEIGKVEQLSQDLKQIIKNLDEDRKKLMSTHQKNNENFHKTMERLDKVIQTLETNTEKTEKVPQWLGNEIEIEGEMSRRRVDMVKRGVYRR
jgi:uncharacterized protein YukE